MSGHTILLSITILLALASNCAQPTPEPQSASTPPRETWKFDTGG